MIVLSPPKTGTNRFPASQQQTPAARTLPGLLENEELGRFNSRSGAQGRAQPVAARQNPRQSVGLQVRPPPRKESSVQSQLVSRMAPLFFYLFTAKSGSGSRNWPKTSRETVTRKWTTETGRVTRTGRIIRRLPTCSPARPSSSFKVNCNGPLASCWAAWASKGRWCSTGSTKTKSSNSVQTCPSFFCFRRRTASAQWPAKAKRYSTDRNSFPFRFKSLKWSTCARTSVISSAAIHGSVLFWNWIPIWPSWPCARSVSHHLGSRPSNQLTISFFLSRY